MIDEQGAAELLGEISARLTERVEAARVRRVQQDKDRADKQRRRDAGLRARHARKAARAVAAPEAATADRDQEGSR